MLNAIFSWPAHPEKRRAIVPAKLLKADVSVDLVVLQLLQCKTITRNDKCFHVPDKLPAPRQKLHGVAAGIQLLKFSASPHQYFRLDTPFCRGGWSVFGDRNSTYTRQPTPTVYEIRPPEMADCHQRCTDVIARDYNTVKHANTLSSAGDFRKEQRSSDSFRDSTPKEIDCTVSNEATRQNQKLTL